MAFKKLNLYSLGGNAKSGVVPAFWSYWNQDNDTVTNANFVPKDTGLKHGDQIIVIASGYTARTNFRVSVNHGTGAVSLIAVT
jgi:hypothetical protein